MSPSNLEVVSAGTVGVDADRLAVLLARVREEVLPVGSQPSAQVAVAKDGRLVASATFGDADASTRYVWQSAGRPVLASVVWKLMSDGLLNVDEKVAAIIPEFDTNGKDIVTVEQVLTHTAGFPLAPLGYPAMTDRTKRLEAFAKWRLTDPPGAVLQYHLTSAGWIIAEIVERRTGLPLSDYLRSAITEPLGLTIELGVPLDRQAGIARFVAISTSTSDGEINPWGAWFLDRPEVIAAGEPSHGIVASAADIALLLQGLYHSPLWDSNVVAEAVRTRVTMCPAGGEALGGSTQLSNQALFVVVAGDHGAGSLPVAVSPTTFGHRGAPTSLCFMDPESGLSFAFVSNGYPPEGYDDSPAGRARMAVLGNLAGDVIKR